MDVKSIGGNEVGRFWRLSRNLALPKHSFLDWKNIHQGGGKEASVADGMLSTEWTFVVRCRETSPMNAITANTVNSQWHCQGLCKQIEWQYMSGEVSF